jgi:uncharacterized surface protein with fasciclin (FAS1) repeats
MMQGDGPITAFAPTDDAFETLPVGTVNRLLDDPKELTAIPAH